MTNREMAAKLKQLEEAIALLRAEVEALKSQSRGRKNGRT
jgi:uncharacterized small protein (DUF1192 family)